MNKESDELRRGQVRRTPASPIERLSAMKPSEAVFECIHRLEYRLDLAIQAREAAKTPEGKKTAHAIAEGVASCIAVIHAEVLGVERVAAYHLHLAQIRFQEEKKRRDA
jgi:hypothetical protein